MHEKIVVGSSNVDFIMKVVRLPAKGESTTNATFMKPLGKGAKQALAAALRWRGLEGFYNHLPARLGAADSAG